MTKAKKVNHGIQIIAILLILFLGAPSFTGCDKNKPMTLPPPSGDTLIIGGDGTTSPYFTGTFIDFWSKENWSAAQWNSHISEMKEVGIKTLFIQFTAYNDYLWTDSDNDYSTYIYQDALHRLLSAANMSDIDVFVGLYFDENFWTNTNNPTTINLHAQRCKDLADDIWSHSKHDKSFAGWYIPQEGAPYYYDTADKFKILKDHLINPVADHCKSISDKPVTTTAFFNHNITDADKLRTFMQRMGSCNLDVILLQDGIGVNHCNLTDLDEYFEAAGEGLFADADFKGAFWADIEVFTPEDKPESFDIVRDKLTIVSNHVRNIIIFQYYNDMAPGGPNAALAQKLRDDYLDYLP